MSSPPQVRPDRYRSRRQLPRWAKVVVVLVSVLVVALLAVGALLAWAVSGGWDGLRGSARPGDREVVDARTRAGDELTRLSADVAHRVGPADPVARIRYDRCEQGQNNWKVHDGYTLRCELTESVVLPAADADVTAAGARIDAALLAAGWAAEGGRDEMTEPADPDHTSLRQTRGHRYLRDAGRHLVDVGITTTGTSPVSGDVPYDPSTPVDGDLAAYRSAVAAPGLKVVVRTTVRYFEDD